MPGAEAVASWRSLLAYSLHICTLNTSQIQTFPYFVAFLIASQGSSQNWRKISKHQIFEIAMANCLGDFCIQANTRTDILKQNIITFVGWFPWRWLMETWLNTLTDYKSKLGGKMAIGQGYQRTIQGNLLYDLLGKGTDAIVQALVGDLENHLMVLCS